MNKFNGRVMVDPSRMTKAEPDMLIPKLSTLRKQSDVHVSRDAPDGKVVSRLPRVKPLIQLTPDSLLTLTQ